MVSFERPEDIERDLGQAAKEAFLVQCYRDGRLSVGQVAEILGRGVMATQDWLAERGAPLTYTLEHLEEDRKSLARDFPEMRS